MSNINNGGPAFPVADPFSVECPPTDEEALRLRNGMTLRDYFAARAMQALLLADGTINFNFRAKDAYEMADAMLKAREAA